VVLDNSFRKQYTRRCGNGNRSGASRLWNSVICDSQENTQYPVLNTQHSDAKSNATTVEPGSQGGDYNANGTSNLEEEGSKSHNTD